VVRSLRECEANRIAHSLREWEANPLAERVGY
jgi:hypothetical protein